MNSHRRLNPGEKNWKKEKPSVQTEISLALLFALKLLLSKSPILDGLHKVKTEVFSCSLQLLFHSKSGTKKPRFIH